MEFDTNLLNELFSYFKQGFFIGLGLGLVSWFAPWCISQIVGLFKRLSS